MNHLASSPGFANATVADAVLADDRLGRRAHYAICRRYLQYDGQFWTIRHPSRELKRGTLDWQLVVWLREWLTQGVIELEQDFRPRPGYDPSEFVMDLVLPATLVFTGRWGDPVYAHSRNLWNCNCGRTETP
jgi:hypothetical protein